ncbi:MAG: PAS domain-containing protein [Ignavibacteriales bacterium]|nr:PAS domain-containing protein [Ignavibacteriales bacterium]
MKEVQHIINKNKEAAATPDGIVVIGKDYSVVVFNEAASRITGFTQRDVLNKKASILFQNCPDGNLYVENVFKNQTTFTNLSLNLETKSRFVKVLELLLRQLLIMTKVLSVVFVFRDVYEMIKMSETLEKRTVELIEQKNKLDAIFNSNIEGTFTINDDWEITSFNASAQRITGYSIEGGCWAKMLASF